MASLQISGFSLTQEQIAQLSSDGTGVAIHIMYDSTAPAGFYIAATGSLGSMILCAKPCNKVTLNS